ncbi:Monocyte to macrophage differentiation factor 2 [Clonorchis sinensis]|uniref:Monocyte to macrophage differentiation factor 2 n=2 Tax=Clonorchis sinensis TaxID=79923 RepID=A0A8T1N2R8_CLOSI|nr:Monocyte to macrophage differentiation factor 2 [Clonorchis sinensis]GAA51276.1 monocyte to macrophage differentiation protein [Clonorchis sinensis]
MGRNIRWKNTPAPPGMPYCPTTLEHVANCATHLPWIPVSMFGLQRLYSKSTNHIELSSAIIYGMAVVCLFLTSSAFHVCSFLSHNSRIRVILHKCDRVVIYIFIAASYTPWLVLRDFHASWGLFTLWLVWIGALLGSVFQCIYHERCKWLELLFYLVVAVCPACTVFYMHEWSGIPLMLTGGLIYSFGIVFYKMDGRIPMAHAIWHCFVFVGAYLHFLAVDSFLILG